MAMLFHAATWAQQVIDLAPGRAPSAQIMAQAWSHSAESEPPEILRILNMAVDSEDQPVVHLELQRTTGSVTKETQFFVEDDQGWHPIQVDVGTLYTGNVKGSADTSALVRISPEGNIHAIIGMDGETIVSEYTPGTYTTASSTISRSMRTDDFAQHPLKCGVKDAHHIPLSFDTGDSISIPQMSKASHNDKPIELYPRKADIILVIDEELYKHFKNRKEASNYVTDVMNYVNQQYENEISTRLNVTDILFTIKGKELWYELEHLADVLDAFTRSWGRDVHSKWREKGSHHVHLMTGMRLGQSGVANINTLGDENESFAVSVLRGGALGQEKYDFVMMADAQVVAHEIGHIFGSPHTHAYDDEINNDKSASPIDCCSSEGDNSRCDLFNAQLKKEGKPPIYPALPGINSLSGGSLGGQTGTIMSYCTKIDWVGQNAWSFGTNHSYGIRPERVPQTMREKAQEELPVDDAATTHTLSVIKAEGGTVKAAGIDCGNESDKCTAIYHKGAAILLAAKPDKGYKHTGWSSVCTSASGRCTITMNSNASIQAIFSPTSETKRLHVVINRVNVQGNYPTMEGIRLKINDATCGDWAQTEETSTCGADFPPGSPVVMQVDIDPSNSEKVFFSGWNSAGTCWGTDKTCRFTLNDTTTITANFMKNESTTGICKKRPFTISEDIVLSFYVAFYGRPPDTGGFDYWATQLDINKGNISDLIEPFSNEAEYTEKFGPLDNKGKINRLYNQILGRDADDEGLEYYSKELERGNITPGAISISIMDGVKGGEDEEVLERRKEFARAYITNLERGEFAENDYKESLSRLIQSISTQDDLRTACREINLYK